MEQNLDLFNRIKEAGQGHLVQHYHEIEDPQKQKEYLKQLESVDY